LYLYRHGDAKHNAWTGALVGMSGLVNLH
jgi:hypothetical protein